jgi:hypothetical protein
VCRGDGVVGLRKLRDRQHVAGVVVGVLGAPSQPVHDHRRQIAPGLPVIRGLPFFSLADGVGVALQVMCRAELEPLLEPAGIRHLGLGDGAVRIGRVGVGVLRVRVGERLLVDPPDGVVMVRQVDGEVIGNRAIGACQLPDYQITQLPDSTV